MSPRTSRTPAPRRIIAFNNAVSPILLGRGRTLLNDGAANLRLDLQEEKRFPSGKLLLRYARAAARTKK